MLLSPEDLLTLLCIKIHSTPEELEQMDGLILQVGDWERFVKNVIDRGIGPLFFKKLPLLANSEQIPEPIKTKLQQAYYRTFSRSSYLYDSFRKVAQVFTEHGIKVIALKGVYLSEWLYQDIGLRQFSDLDLLVKEEDGERCLEVLDGMGYKPVICKEKLSDFIYNLSDIVHYAPMVMNDVSVEIHIKLHYKSKDYQININHFIEHALPVTLNTVPVYALNIQDLLIHLCVHLDKHFRGGHVQFTCFNDITNLLELYGAEIDWNDFITTCRLHKCEHAVMEYIVMVNEYMHVGLSEAIVEKYKTLLTEDDEFLFIQYLNGNTQQIKPFSAVPAHLENLKNLNVKDRSRYLLDLLFPPKGFMISKYGHQFTIRNTIRNSQFIIHNSNTKIHNSQFIIHKIRVPWWFLYPYRWGVGVKGVMKIIRRNP